MERKVWPATKRTRNPQHRRWIICSCVRDGAEVTDSVLSDAAAAYTPGISERRSSTTKLYHSDRLGTVTRLTDTSSSTTDTRQYDAFGLLVASSGSTPTPFGFVGSRGY